MYGTPYNCYQTFRIFVKRYFGIERKFPREIPEFSRSTRQTVRGQFPGLSGLPMKFHCHQDAYEPWDWINATCTFWNKAEISGINFQIFQIDLSDSSRAISRFFWTTYEMSVFPRRVRTLGSD